MAAARARAETGASSSRAAAGRPARKEAQRQGGSRRAGRASAESGGSRESGGSSESGSSSESGRGERRRQRGCGLGTGANIVIGTSICIRRPHHQHRHPRRVTCGSAVVVAWPPPLPHFRSTRQPSGWRLCERRAPAASNRGTSLSFTHLLTCLRTHAPTHPPTHPPTRLPTHSHACVRARCARVQVHRSAARRRLRGDGSATARRRRLGDGSAAVTRLGHGAGRRRGGGGLKVPPQAPPSLEETRRDRGTRERGRLAVRSGCRPPRSPPGRC